MSTGINYGALLSIEADTQREFGRFSWFKLIAGLIFRRPFRAVISMRFCQAANACPPPIRMFLLPLARVFHGLCAHWAGIDFPWVTSIAPGLALTHGWGLVVTPGAQIGSNVTLFHGVTLGRRDRISSDGRRESGYPVIEDDVWIGPHAIVVGDVTIGRGSRIAGGACVYRSVPPFSMVAGNPAVVIKSACTPDVPNRFVVLP